MTSNLRQEAERIAGVGYATIIFRDETTDGGWVYLAVNPDLDGCMAQGETTQEAQRNLDEFRIDYIVALLENGQDVPSPKSMLTKTSTNVIKNIVEARKMEEPNGENTPQFMIQSTH